MMCLCKFVTSDMKDYIISKISIHFPAIVLFNLPETRKLFQIKFAE